MKSKTNARIESCCELCEAIARLGLPASVHAMFTCANEHECGKELLQFSFAVAA